MTNDQLTTLIIDRADTIIKLLEAIDKNTQPKLFEYRVKSPVSEMNSEQLAALGITPDKQYTYAHADLIRQDLKEKQ